MLIKNSRIALAQIRSVLGDVKANVAIHEEEVAKALKQGADAIVFPELSLTGYTLRDLNFEVAIDPHTDAALGNLKELSKQITIIFGCVTRDDRGGVFNAAVALEDGNVLHVHRKIYPPTYNIFEENRYFSSGDSLNAFDSRRLGRCGLLVCEDLWHPSLPYLLAMDDAQLLITIAASPTRLDFGTLPETRTKMQNYEINRENHAAYARLLQLYLVFVNKVGVEDGVNFWGGSEVIGPNGECVGRQALYDKEMSVFEIAAENVRHARQNSRHFLDEDHLLTARMFSEILDRRRAVTSQQLSFEDQPEIK